MFHYDCILIFKILVLQSLYNLSDNQTGDQIKDRFSFMKFLDLTLCQKIPDAKTIWLYRERLAQKGLIENLFTTFEKALKERVYLTASGQIIDDMSVQAWNKCGDLER